MSADFPYRCEPYIRGRVSQSAIVENQSAAAFSLAASPDQSSRHIQRPNSRINLHVSDRNPWCCLVKPGH